MSAVQPGPASPFSESGGPMAPPPPGTVKCDAAPMKNNIGIENTTLVREARNARRPAAGAAAFAWPPDAAATADAMTIFCFGQMTRHTFASITVPNRAPVRIVTAHGEDQAADPSGDSPMRLPMIAAPVRNVSTADQRNQASARGTSFCVAALFVAASASAMNGPCTKLK